MRALIGLACAFFLMTTASAFAASKIVVSYGAGSAYMPALVAKDQGIFAQHGLDATMQFIAIGSNQPAALISGAAQVAGLNPAIVLFADQGGANLTIIAGANVQLKGDATGGAIARNGVEIKAPADFRGKKVAVPGLQSVIHIAFMKWLKDRGVDPNAVTYIEVPINQMNEALKDGRIDVALTAAPFYDQILVAKSGHLVADFQGDLADPSTVYSVWAMDRDYMKAHPEIAPAFKTSIEEAIGFIAKNEAAARKTLVTYLHLPEPVAMSVKLATFTADMTSAQMQWWVDACEELGLSKGSVPLSELLSPVAYPGH